MGPLRRVKLTELNAHLVCVLCSGYFVDATTIIECLHTFCKTCIVRYLQTSSFCPICDVQVHKTKPLLSLREDRTLQDVVFKLVPDLFHSEMHRRFRFYKDHPEAGGDRTEQSLRERRHFFHVDDQISLSLEYLPSAPTSTSYYLGLKPHNINNSQLEKTNKIVEEDKEGLGEKKEEVKKEEEKEEENMPGKVIHKRYLKCPAAVQVSHLEKFIRLKYSLPSNSHKVDIMHGGDCLVGELTLLDVVYMYKWTEDAPLRLMYTVSTIPQMRKRPRSNGLRTSTATDTEAPASKVPKTQQPVVLQQQSAHQLTHSQVHPISGRDQDSMETSTNGKSVCTVAQNVIISEAEKVVSVALTTASSAITVTSSIGLVSTPMSINIPSLPNTILNSGIGKLPAALTNGRRTAFTKTTAATSTPRLAVPNKSFTTTETASSITGLEGVAVTVQVTTPVSTLTSSVAVTYTNTTNTNTNVLPVAPLPVTTVQPLPVTTVQPLPVTTSVQRSLNGFIDSCVTINSASTQPPKLLRPVIPSKPRLGRPPNSSRVSAASMKPGIVRTVDNRPIRPVAPGKIVNKVQGVTNRTNTIVSASLNVQSRLNSISGPKLGNAKVSIKRLNEVPKVINSAGTTENSNKKLPSSTNLGNTESQPVMSMSNIALSSQQSPNGTVSHHKPVTSLAPEVASSPKPMNTSEVSVTPKHANIQSPGPHSQDIQKADFPSVQSTTTTTAQPPGVNKVQKSPLVQNQRLQGNQPAPRPLQQPPLGGAIRPSPNNGSQGLIPQCSEQATLPTNKLSQSAPRAPAPVNSIIRSPAPSHGTGNSQTTVSSPLGPNISSSPIQSSQNVANKPNQVTPNRTIANTTLIRATTPTQYKSVMTTAANKMPNTVATNRMPSGPAQRSPVSPAINRPLSNSVYRPPTQAPHRPPASPAPHRAPASPAPHRAPASPAPHRAPPSPAPHRAPPSPAPHRAPPSPAPHRAPPSPAPHRAPPSPAPHRAPPSPAPHRAPPSPAPHRAPPSPAPHRAPPSPAPHRAPPSPASLQAPPSPASLQAPPSPAPVQAPPSPATLPTPASPAPPSPASQQGQLKPSPVTTNPNSQVTLPTTSNSSTTAVAQSQPTGLVGSKTTTSILMSNASSKEVTLLTNNGSSSRMTTGHAGSKAPAPPSKPGTTVATSTNSTANNNDVKVLSAKVSPSVKPSPKSPGRKKGGGGSSPTILSIAQNLANRQLQQRTVNSTPLSGTITTNSTPNTQVSTQQTYTTTPNTIVYPGQVGSGLVSPALAAAYMASAYGGDASALADVTAMRNLITLSQTAACIRELNIAAMVQAAETIPRPSDPAPIDLSPTSKAAPQSPLTNGRGQTITTTSPLSSTKPAQSAKSKTSTSNAANAPTISPPTPEVTITKLPSTPVSTSSATNPPVTNSGKNVPGLVKIASSSTNTVSITKRPVSGSGNRIPVAKSLANASVRQISNPSSLLLRHQSEVRNNNNVTKSSPMSTTGGKSNITATTISTKNQQSPKLTSNNTRVPGNSPLKETGPLPETSSILKIENLTRSLAPAAAVAAAAAAASSPSYRRFDNR